MKITLTALLSLFTVVACTQVKVFGKIRDFEQNKMIEDAWVYLEYEDGYEVDIPTNGKGKFDLELELGSRYAIRFEGEEPYVSKFVVFDLSDVDDGSFGFDMEVNLFPAKDGVDYSSLNEFPLGVARYSQERGEIVFDAKEQAMLNGKHKAVLLAHPE